MCMCRPNVNDEWDGRKRKKNESAGNSGKMGISIIASHSLSHISEANDGPQCRCPASTNQNGASVDVLGIVDHESPVVTAT